MMSFYEWCLLMERYSVKAEQRKFDWENGWDQTRRTMAMLGNMFRGKESQPLRPEDIIQLSWDKSTHTNTQLTAEEIKKLAIKRFGKTLNRKNGNGK